MLEGGSSASTLCGARSSAELDLRLGVDWRLLVALSIDKSEPAEVGRRYPVSEDVSLDRIGGLKFTAARLSARWLSFASALLDSVTTLYRCSSTTFEERSNAVGIASVRLKLSIRSCMFCIIGMREDSEPYRDGVSEPRGVRSLNGGGLTEIDGVLGRYSAFPVPRQSVGTTLFCSIDGNGVSGSDVHVSAASTDRSTAVYR